MRSMARQYWGSSGSSTILAGAPYIQLPLYQHICGLDRQQDDQRARHAGGRRPAHTHALRALQTPGESTGHAPEDFVILCKPPLPANLRYEMRDHVSNTACFLASALASFSLALHLAARGLRREGEAADKIPPPTTTQTRVALLPRLLLCAFYSLSGTSHRIIVWLRVARDTACSCSHPVCGAHTRSRV